MNGPLSSQERAALWRAQTRVALQRAGNKPEPDEGDFEVIARLAIIAQEISQLLVVAAGLSKQSPFTKAAARDFENARGSVGMAWAAFIETDAGLKFTTQARQAAAR